MTGHFLVLYPKDFGWAPETTAILTDALKSIGFLGCERSPGRYGTGRAYLDLITYLGCSPQVTLGDSEAATTIRINGIFETPQFLHGANLKAPRCPRCRKALEKPPATLAADERLRCSHCGYGGNVCEFDWRHSAACARAFVEISNVFESEAVPGEQLIACLKEAGGESWDYCYLREAGG